MLGLGNRVGKTALITPGIVTSNLKLKHNYNAGAVVPVSDGAVLLDGTGDYISITEQDLSVNDTAYSFAFWAKRNTITSWDTVLGHSSTDPNYVSSSWIFFDDAGGDRLMIESITDNDNLTGAISMIASKWYHFAICLGTDGTGQIYQDGAKVTTTGDGSDSPLGAHLKFNRIGMTSNHPFNGYLCNLAYWNKTLTQPQVKSIMFKSYADLNSDDTTSLISWWNLDEGAGTTATDSHGSNNGSATFT